MELNPLSNKIQKVLNLTLLSLYIHTFMYNRRVIAIYKFLVRLEGFSISCSKLHSEFLT